MNIILSVVISDLFLNCGVIFKNSISFFFPLSSDFRLQVQDYTFLSVWLVYGALKTFIALHIRRDELNVSQFLCCETIDNIENFVSNH